MRLANSAVGARTSVFSDIFERAFRHAPIPTAVVAKDGSFLDANEALCRFVGYTRDELLTRTLPALTRAAGAEDLVGLAGVEQVLSGQLASYELDARYTRKTGETVWGRLSVARADDGPGAPLFAVVQIQDVTSLRRAERDAARFFETSPDLLVVTGKTGRLELLSPSWQQVLGWTRDEMSARDFLEFVHPDDRERTVAEAHKVYAGTPTPGFRNRYLTRDGAYRWLEWSTRPSDDGRLFCVVRDVTEKVETEWERQWLAAVVETSTDGIVGVNHDGVVFSWNAGAERLYGYTAAEMRGRPISVLAPDSPAQARIVSVVARAQAGEALQEYEAVRRRKDGSLVDVHVHVRRVEDRTGVAMGWSVTARDISERRRLTEALVRQADLYAAIARSLPLGSVTVFDRDLRWVVAEGEELLAVLGTSKAALLGRDALGTITDENRARLEVVYRSALAGEYTELQAERAGRSLLIRVAPMHGAQGDVTGGLVLTLDVTAQRAQAEELRRAKLLLEATVTNIEDGVALFDQQQRLLLANDAYAGLLGVDEAKLADLDKRGLFALLRDRLADPEAVAARFMAPPQETSVEEIAFARPERRVLRRLIKPIGVGGEGGYLAVWRDVTPERNLLAQRDREAHTDELTGLANRRGAEQALRTAVTSGVRGPVAVALLDVDHFKHINDAHGHQVGDRVLRAIAQVLAQSARATDVVARWGGEEFIAVLPGEAAGAVTFCERVRAGVRALHLGEVHAVTISAGVAAAAGDVQEVLERADRCLYVAKTAGRDRVVSG